MGTRRSALLALGAALLAFTSCLFDSEEEILGIDGYVRDEAGEPAAGVLMRKTGSESGSTYTRDNGYYWVSIDRGSDSVTLTPVKNGWVFCPGAIAFSNPGGRLHNQNFTGFFGGEIAIEGFVRDAEGYPVEGVAVVNEAPTALYGLSSITGYDGRYRFGNILPGFSYEFVPRKAGCSFAPARRSYTLPNRDYRAQDFVITCVSEYAVEGYIRDPAGNGVEGVRVAFSGTELAAVTGKGGYYRGEGIPPDVESVVTPQKDGCLFYPRTWSANERNRDYRNVDFTAYCDGSFSITGYIHDEKGNGLSGFSVRLFGGWTGGDSVCVTAEDGYYEFTDLLPGFDYTLRPSGAPCSFNPPEIAIGGLQADLAGQDFVVSCPPLRYASGHVLDKHGEGVEGVEVCLRCFAPDFSTGSDGLPPRSALPDTCVTTDEAGYYSISYPASVEIGCTVEPKKPGCRFSPCLLRCPCDEDRTDLDFTAYCGDGYGIGGYVRDREGNGIEGVYIVVTGLCNGPVFTDVDGYYEIPDVPAGVDFSVYPYANELRFERCIFCPGERVYSNLDAGRTGQDFTLSCPY